MDRKKVVQFMIWGLCAVMALCFLMGLKAMFIKWDHTSIESWTNSMERTARAIEINTYFILVFLQALLLRSICKK